MVRIGIADQRGDGRPDYAYNGWVLYADTVQPARLPASGGPIVIHGMGFRLADTVLVGGQPALVTSISPNEITAIAPPAAAGVTGSVDVEVDDLPIFYAAAVVSGGVSYDSGTGDALTLVTAPMNTVPIGVPIPFTVTALGPDLTPAGGVTVIYTVTSGTATLACGLPVCSVTATGDGRATMNVTAIRRHLVHRHRLAHQRLQPAGPICRRNAARARLAHAPAFARRRRHLHLDRPGPGALKRRARRRPDRGLADLRHRHRRALGSTAAITNASGIATKTLTVGPLTEGQTATINACLNGTSQCVAFTAFGARPEYASLEAVSGTAQSLAVSGTPAPDHPPRPRHGRQPHGRRHGRALPGALRLGAALRRARPSAPRAHLLATQAATATSALDGTVTFIPGIPPRRSHQLLGLAASGNTATVSIAIEQHP